MLVLGNKNLLLILLTGNPVDNILYSVITANYNLTLKFGVLFTEQLSTHSYTFYK